MNEDELVRVTLITVKVGEKEFVLTPEEARKLRRALDDLLGPTQPVVVTTPVYPYTPQPCAPWSEPIWINPNIEPWPNGWQTTCQSFHPRQTNLIINANG